MQRAHSTPFNFGSPHPSRSERLHMVLELVSQGHIKSQYDIQHELAARGVVVNQATLSRDVHALGLLKGKDGYEVPTQTSGPVADASLALYSAVHAWFASAEAAGSLVVVKTPPGGANPLAIAIDRAGWAEVAGTIAGDDTLFVATRSVADARRVTKSLSEMKVRKQPR
ncbi:MAG: arginine repressor [Planctomycetota bacterium]|nr:arginine repressor [Planctomycetota bacterium]